MSEKLGKKHIDRELTKIKITNMDYQYDFIYNEYEFCFKFANNIRFFRVFISKYYLDNETKDTIMRRIRLNLSIFEDGAADYVEEVLYDYE